MKAGGEAALHTLRVWLQRHESASDKVVAKLDFRNAFNTIDRIVVLREARTQFPALVRWAPSTLRFGQEQLLSCAGVQQGDPLGYGSPAFAPGAPRAPLRLVHDCACFTWIMGCWRVNLAKSEVAAWFRGGGALAL